MEINNLFKIKKAMEIFLEKGIDARVSNNHKYSSLHFLACKKFEKKEEKLSKIVKLLIENGANVNQRTCNDDLPIHFACSSGNEFFAHQLLSFKSDYHTINRFGDTPLMLAIRGNHVATVELLLDAGASVDYLSHCELSQMKEISPELVNLLKKRSIPFSLYSTKSDSAFLHIDTLQSSVFQMLSSKAKTKSCKRPFSLRISVNNAPNNVIQQTLQEKLQSFEYTPPTSIVEEWMKKYLAYSDSDLLVDSLNFSKFIQELIPTLRENEIQFLFARICQQKSTNEKLNFVSFDEIVENLSFALHLFSNQPQQETEAASVVPKSKPSSAPNSRIALPPPMPIRKSGDPAQSDSSVNESTDNDFSHSTESSDVDDLRDSGSELSSSNDTNLSFIAASEQVKEELINDQLELEQNLQQISQTKLKIQQGQGAANQQGMPKPRYPQKTSPQMSRNTSQKRLSGSYGGLTTAPANRGNNNPTMSPVLKKRPPPPPHPPPKVVTRPRTSSAGGSNHLQQNMQIAQHTDADLPDNTNLTATAIAEFLDQLIPSDNSLVVTQHSASYKFFSNLFDFLIYQQNNNRSENNHPDILSIEVFASYFQDSFTTYNLLHTIVPTLMSQKDLEIP